MLYHQSLHWTLDLKKAATTMRSTKSSYLYFTLHRFQNFRIHAIRDENLFIGTFLVHNCCLYLTYALNAICAIEVVKRLVLYLFALSTSISGDFTVHFPVGHTHYLPYSTYTLTWVEWSALHNLIAHTNILMYASIQKVLAKRLLVLFVCCNCFVLVYFAQLNDCT